MKPKILKIIGLCCLFLVLGIAAGFKYGTNVPQGLSTTVIRENPSGYKFINPVLLFTVGDKTNFPQYAQLQGKVTDIINKAIRNDDAANVSVYFRNLTDETWMGINETDKYTPSSMLKVSIMMAYLKIKETDPSIMTEKQYYKYEDDPGQNFKPANPLPPGLYTNEDLIKIMIEQSDNTAEQILSNYILNSSRHDEFAQVFVDLHIPLPTAEGGSDFLSPQEYSRLFRALYNGAYLPNSFSESALQLLSETTFDKGLRSGVPAKVVVAHKFGEHTVFNTTDGSIIERQLHDCGIVYKPGSPYFLCVMTRGKEFENLASVISSISSTVYQNVGTSTAQ